MASRPRHRRQPSLADKFDAVATPPPKTADPAQRHSVLRSLGVDELARKLMVCEDEVTACRLQASKRLSLYLNRRLEAMIEQWKAAHMESGAAAQARTANLGLAISEGRRKIEDALQIMLAQQPAGAPPTLTPSMRFAVKARFQGTPASTLKAAPVSQNWVRSVGAREDPLFALGSGPAQRWRFRWPALEEASVRADSVAAMSGNEPPREASVALLDPSAIKAAFTRFDADASGGLDVSELAHALQHLGVANQRADELIARYDTRGEGGLGNGKLLLDEFVTLCREVAKEQSRQVGGTRARGADGEAGSPAVNAAAAASVGLAGDAGEDAVRLTVGVLTELLLEAVDAEGRVDVELYSTVLLEEDTDAPLLETTHAAPPPPPHTHIARAGTSGRCAGGMAARAAIDGLGFLSVVAGVARTMVCCSRAGTLKLALQDGARAEPPLSVLAAPLPLHVTFVSGAVVRTVLLPSANEATAGDEIEVCVRVVDEFDNCVTSVGSGLVVLTEASGRPVRGIEKPIELHGGEATVRASSEAAAEVVLRVAEVSGFAEAIVLMSRAAGEGNGSNGTSAAMKMSQPAASEGKASKSTSTACKTSRPALGTTTLRFTPGVPSLASIRLAPDAVAVAGRPIPLHVELHDGCANLLQDASLYAQLNFVGVTLERDTQIERSYEVCMDCGHGLVTLMSQSASVPIVCWLALCDGATLDVKLKHWRRDPSELVPQPAEPASYVLGRTLKPVPQAEYEVLIQSAEEKEAAAAAAAADKEEAERAAVEMALEATRITESAAAKREAEAATAAAAVAAAEAAVAKANAAAAAEATSREAAEIAAARAAEAAAASDAAAEAQRAAEVAAGEAVAAATAAQEAAEAEAAAAKAAAEGKEAADLALRTAWKAKEQAAAAATIAATERDFAEAATAAGPLQVGQPVTLTVTAKVCLERSLHAAHMLRSRSPKPTSNADADAVVRVGLRAGQIRQRHWQPHQR
jgi:hypothetical protein